MVHGLKVGHLIELRYWQHGGGGGGSCFWQWVPWLTWYSPHPKCERGDQMDRSANPYFTPFVCIYKLMTHNNKARKMSTYCPPKKKKKKRVIGL
jgi:hypothetical protein